MISPLLANVFLHYVFDPWIAWWRKHRCRGDVVVVRYADDFVIGFERQSEAAACLEELRTRFAKFGLKLHEGKTRLMESTAQRLGLESTLRPRGRPRVRPLPKP